MGRALRLRTAAALSASESDEREHEIVWLSESRVAVAGATQTYAWAGWHARVRRVAEHDPALSRPERRDTMAALGRSWHRRL